MPSFTFDLTGMMTVAAQIFNGLSPIFFTIVGVSVGVGLLLLVVNEVRRAF